MAGSTTGSWWQYSRWTKNLARNARITNPIGFEALVYRVIVGSICDPSGNTGSRPWLADSFRRLSVGGSGDNYNFDPSKEPIYAIVKAVEIIGRDFKKIPITDAEKGLMDAVFAVTNNRRLGSTPYFGGVGGSVVSIP